MPDILKFPGVDEDPEDAVFCEKCGTTIPPERIEAIPGTICCVSCSTTKAKVGFMEPTLSKGTASEIILVDADDKESVRLAKRSHSDRGFERR